MFYFLRVEERTLLPKIIQHTVSKIALIKLVELLDAEINDVAFSILGPGWVNTKIHEQSLEPFCVTSHLTKDRGASVTDFVDMKQVIASIMWIFSQDKKAVGGRNFSTAHDPFESDFFAETLLSDPDVFKLRRHGNHFFNSKTN